MVALLDRSGAYLYDCSAEEFERRMEADKINYDHNGDMRRERDGLIGWFFSTSGLIQDIMKMGCEAAFISIPGEKFKIIHSSQFASLHKAYHMLYQEKQREVQ